MKSRINPKWPEFMQKIHSVQNPEILQRYIGLIGEDKIGKGTTYHQAIFALSELGYDMRAMTFPDYHNIYGLLIEMNLNFDHIKENAQKLLQNNNTTFMIRNMLDNLNSWFKEPTAYLLPYAADRLNKKIIFEEELTPHTLFFSKRTSFATHGAYQAGLKGFDEMKVKALDDFFPYPDILVNLYRFLDIKFSSNKFVYKKLDENEAQKQDFVRELQKKYTLYPDIADSQYGFFVPNVESPDRLALILEHLSKILLSNRILPNLNKRGSLITYGQEECKYNFSTEEGLLKFIWDCSLGKFSILNRAYSLKTKDLTELAPKERYTGLITDMDGEPDAYALNVYPKIIKVINEFKQVFHKNL